MSMIAWYNLESLSGWWFLYILEHLCSFFCWIFDEEYQETLERLDEDNDEDETDGIDNTTDEIVIDNQDIDEYDEEKDK